MMGIPLEALNKKKKMLFQKTQTTQQIVKNLHKSIYNPYLYILILEAWLYWVGLQACYDFSVQWL